MTQPRLTIIHPFVQQYRMTLYEHLYTELKAEGIDFRVIGGPASPALRAREDSVSARWSQYVPTTWLALGNKEVAIRHLQRADFRHGEFVIVEQAIKNMETYRLLHWANGDHIRLAFWGHGKTYSIRQSPLLERTKFLLTRRADWFFAYTDDGRAAVVEHGVDPSRVTVLRNTIDTAGLRSDINSISTEEMSHYRSHYGLTKGATGLFLGGVDRAKGIGFLLEATRLIHLQLPEFRLLVAGSGSQVDRVLQASRELPVHYIGRVIGKQKAIALEVADLLLIPKWIGLVAVDSLVAGVPIVSTEPGAHAPEREYLVDNEHAVFSSDSPSDYADSVVAMLSDAQKLAAMSLACRTEATEYSIDGYVQRFLQGIHSWMSAVPGHRDPTHPRRSDSSPGTDRMRA